MIKRYSMVKAVIFDLDGVLAKTDSFHYLSWKKICDTHAYLFDKVMNNELRGVSREECLKIILGYNNITLSDEDFKKVCDEENENYNHIVDDITEQDLFPGVVNLLKKLKGDGFPLAIGTISKHAKTTIEKLKIGKFFNTIVDGNMVKKAKPDPECFLLCAKNLGISPKDILVIEDADSGIIAANKGGFISVAFGNAKNNKEAKYIVDSIEEIDNIIKTENK